MRRALLIFVALGLLSATPAQAGKYFDPGAGLGPATASSCDQQWPATDPIPAWSRLTWSLTGGITISTERDAGGDHPAAAVVVPQVAVQVLTRERRCRSGGGLFSDHLWRRWSLAVSADAVWAPGDGAVELRPSLRLARSHFRRGLLSIGTEWLPSSELFVTAGPTFDPGWSGASLGIGGRASVVQLEVRGALHTDRRGGEVLVLFGVTDLHGLWDRGSTRTD